jgi:hypothetical protein
MKDFISHLRAAWNYAHFVPLITSLDHEDEWTVEDAAAYTKFKNSPTGQKLNGQVQRFLSLSAVNATQAPQHELIRRCGWSSGLTAAFTWLDRHMAKPEQETNPETEDAELEELV